MRAEYSKEKSAEKQRQVGRFDREGTAAHCRTIVPGGQSGSRPRRSTCSSCRKSFHGLRDTENGPPSRSQPSHAGGPPRSSTLAPSWSENPGIVISSRAL